MPHVQRRAWLEIVGAMVSVLTVMFVVSSALSERLDDAKSSISANTSRVSATESRLDALDLTDERIIRSMDWYHRRVLVTTDSRGER